MANSAHTQQSFRRGLLWFGSGTALARLANVASLLVILRLLSRQALGEASLVLGALIILESLASLGLELAVVQAKRLGRGELASLHWFAVAVGTGLAALVWFAAPLLAVAFDSEALAPLMRLASIKLILLGFCLVPQQRLVRSLRFRRYSVAHTTAGIGEDIAKVALAFAGLGASALVGANVLRGAVLLGCLLGMTRFWPRPRLRFPEVLPHLRFGYRIGLSGVILQGASNVDYFIVGRFLGLEALGLYRAAFELGVMPLDMIGRAIYRIATPVFARHASNKTEFLASVGNVSTALLRLLVPVAGGIAFAAPELLLLAGGTQWLPAVFTAQLLVAGGLLRAYERLLLQGLIAWGRPGLALLEAVLSLGLVAAALMGTVWVAGGQPVLWHLGLGWGLAQVLLFAATWRSCRVAFGLEGRALWHQVRGQLALLVLIGACGLASEALWPHNLANPVQVGLRLAVFVVVLPLLYLGGSRLRRTPAR